MSEPTGVIEPGDFKDVVSYGEMMIPTRCGDGIFGTRPAVEGAARGES